MPKVKNSGTAELVNIKIGFAQRLRLHFIEVMLMEYGTLNRRVIEQYFGISTPQASLDIAKYTEIAPGNVNYDARAKTYRRSESFAPQLQEA